MIGEIDKQSTSSIGDKVIRIERPDIGQTAVKYRNAQDTSLFGDIVSSDPESKKRVPKTVSATPAQLRVSPSHKQFLREKQQAHQESTYDSNIEKGRSSVIAHSEPPADLASISRRSNMHSRLLATSETSLGLVNRHYDAVRTKQERDL